MKDKVIFSGDSNHEKAYIVGNATNEIIPNGLIAKVERKQDFKMHEEKYKQIEEMTKELIIAFGWKFGRPNEFEYIAEYLVEQRYQKLTEDDVVLSREEFDTLKAENDKYVKDCIDYLATINKLENKVWEVEKQTRKETAEKILFKFESAFAYYDKEDMFSKKAIFECLEEIVKSCGVEINE